jgi:hypothetical protein
MRSLAEVGVVVISDELIIKIMPIQISASLGEIET